VWLTADGASHGDWTGNRSKDIRNGSPAAFQSGCSTSLSQQTQVQRRQYSAARVFVFIGRITARG
jgi:hypothetical protein